MELKKELAFVDVFSIASGAMISSGIFILPGLAFSQIGPGVFVSYFLAGMLALCGSFSVVELATAMPKAGGDYFFITRSLGALTGTASGIMSWFALILKSSFAIFGIAEVAHLLLGLPVFPVGAGVTIFFGALNIFGVKGAAKFETLLVFILLLLLMLYILLGFNKVEVFRFDPFIYKDKGINSILYTSGFVFISFGGLLNVASISEEVKNPGRNIPLGMISSILVISVIYALLLIVTIGILPAEELSGSMTPIADTAKLFMGQPGYIAITIAAFLAFVTTANAGIMASSRYPLALSRDKLVPAFMSSVNRKTNTPAIAIIITSLLIILTLLLPLEILVKAASTVILTSYVLSNFCVIILRESGIQNYRPTFKIPLYPWTPIISIIIFIFLIAALGLQAIEISMGLIVLSLIFYLFYGKKASQEYALLRIVERITNRKLTTRNLDEELREIIHQREEIVKDDFDLVIEEALILDLKEAGSRDELFKIVSEKLASKMDVSEDEVFQLLTEREEDTSTIISDLVAIPHIIVEKENTFSILVTRCREGIDFPGETAKPKAIFVISGSKDRRNLHLRSLAAIAGIVQNKSFEKRWLEAPDEAALRDVLLLAKRKRF
jgi:amino acid transporter/mannitol/fructose-specific phosphotransferase system IIA component (Ntr-type)